MFPAPRGSLSRATTTATSARVQKPIDCVVPARDFQDLRRVAQCRGKLPQPYFELVLAAFP